MIRRLAVLLGVMTAASVLTMAPAAAVGGEGEAWPSFTESSGCGAQRLRPPHADSTGWLSRDTILRGPTADMFGRTVQQVFDELSRWGFGIDGGEGDADRDFEAVRGTYEGNSFVKDMQETVAALGDRVEKLHKYLRER